MPEREHERHAMNPSDAQKHRNAPVSMPSVAGKTHLSSFSQRPFHATSASPIAARKDFFIRTIAVF